MNINRDYLIINDVKKSNIKLDNGSMFFYITDKNTQNIFVNLVINVSNNDLIQKYANIENAEDYTLTMNIVKPSNTHKVIEGKLHDKEKAIFEFNLNEDCCDEIGTYRCELLTKCNINNHEEITTSNKLTYKVKSSVLNDLDDIVEAPEYPLVIQLFDKLSDIEQYEEDRRANELARQLAEEQRQTRFNALDSDMVDKITAMDSKMDDVEARISAKEQAVDKLIVDTKVDIDEYKVAKDQEIDEYKAAKDIEINNAITTQDNKIDEAITNQNNKIDDAIANQNNKIDTAIAEQNTRIEIVEASDNTQNTRLNALEAKNQQQDDRLLDVEKVNKRQDMDLKCLFAESKNNMIDVTEEGNSIYLQNSTVGYTLIDEIQGNTMVNCNKEADKELILNGNINTQGYSNVTLTEGVDGGLVDVALEGNTMVNVCDQKDPVAITNSYTVETGNHIALQGEYDYKCRPVVTGNTLVNLCKLSRTQNNVAILDNPTRITGTVTIINAFKSNKVYVNRYKVSDNTYAGATLVTSNVFKLDIPTGQYIGQIYDNTTTDFIPPTTLISDVVILEGDYTDKPIPDYFEGLQSSFEDKVVTQEMVDSGEEVADNLGKYRVDYVVTGKNKANNLTSGYVSSDGAFFSVSNNCRTDFIPIQPNTTYIASISSTDDTAWISNRNYSWFDKDKNFITRITGDYISCTSPSNAKYLIFHNATVGGAEYNITKVQVQIEESTVATSYEPYKEYTKTFYLNSPLLEGDTIEQQGDNVIHVHRSELRAYETDDELTLPTDMINTLVSKTPQDEVISQNDTILCDSYVNGHLDVDSVVPVKRVKFMDVLVDLKYKYQGTEYNIQFESDNVGIVNFYFDAWYFYNSVVKGMNKFTLTSKPEGTAGIASYISFDGIGFNASNIVVTEATDQDFGYFEGMKSVGECEDLEVVSSNSDGTLSNIQTLTHEPLRAVGDIKDKYVLIDGKWYIERNCGVRAYQEGDIDNYITDMVNTVYPLSTPTYEPIDYNPFTVYSDVTHISNNSTIPCNMTIKNTGYNCLLKPSTTYTVSSNLGLNTVTTPSTLTEDCLRFYDTDTSDVTTMKNVMVLEGDYTTGKPLPSHFSGIESAFEQEYDEEKGKYKVKIRAQNEDASKENYIEFYIDEPLRGIGDVKDKVYVKDDKVVVERNCGQRAYQDGDFGTYLTDKVNTVYPLAEPTYEEVEYNDVKLFIESFKNSTLFYNSNVPVTSTVHYSYSVPIVDTVAQTASISDEQDNMIIDLATQVAVMEMMLM